MPGVRRVSVLVAVVALATVGAAVASAAMRANEPIEIRARYSAFGPSTVRVPAGRPVTFVLVNDDPIDHEWIVGDEGVHERHRTGTEPVHGARPTEITLPAGETRRTTLVFETPGTLRFVCHLPGHEAYGMSGVVIVER